MNQFQNFNLPICLTIEDDAFWCSDEIIKRYIPEVIGKKALIVTGPSVVNLFRDKIMEISRDFDNADIHIIKEASLNEAICISKKTYPEDIEVILGVGGGRVLDTAKYAAHMSKVVYICMATALSTDSLASPFSVLEIERNVRQTLLCRIPTAIIVDTNLVANAPINLIRSGIGDTIAKYTALFDWKLSAKIMNSNVNDFAYMLAKMSYDSVFHCDEKDIKSSEFIKILSRALVMSGLAMEIANSPRPCSGSEHLFAHVIEENYPQISISHGINAALGVIPACIFQGRTPDKIMQFYHTFGLDFNLEHYGISEEMFTDMWEKAVTVRPGRITILNQIKLDRAKLKEIYHMMIEG